MNVIVYSTPTCGYCHQAKKFLADRGVKYTERDVSQDRVAADEMVRLTGQSGVPVIVVDGQPIIGFDRPRLEALLAKGSSGNRLRFGIKIADASKITQRAGVLPVFGALVGDVAAGSLGERVGFKPGDIVTEFNLRKITNAGDLEKALAGMAHGNRATVSVLRGRETVQLEIQV